MDRRGDHAAGRRAERCGPGTLKKIAMVAAWCAAVRLAQIGVRVHQRLTFVTRVFAWSLAALEWPGQVGQAFQPDFPA
jgi:hypothetical protein